ncbi:hypothetical protein JHE55_002216 [Salmonella enterica]|uniref:hypothetical protein n=1 Tax=Salmonella enterica TaxID=28901 RepID=UPI00071AE596|nr:hypothetical protein [Salmonella enterica]EGX7443826.1 hypothetical protein [Salmonella enterica]EGX9277033.1 hypothetical protein [Salmonella enterica]KSA98977.1 hypothetical protein LFZ11_00440 [Salmonella enterica subsp. enterica serovar Fresno str. ST224]
MITKNFRLNALANQYAAALYNHIASKGCGERFLINADGCPIQVDIVGGVKGIRDLIDGYALGALKDEYPQWEDVGIQLLNKCVRNGELTKSGREIWQSMVNDMGSTVADRNGGKNA